MKSLNHMFWRDTDGRNKELRSTFDYDGDKLIKPALGIVIAVQRIASALRLKNPDHISFQSSCLDSLCFPGVSPNLRD